jgi:hypothetical protein
VASYRSYISSYPNGAHATEAQRGLNEAEWREALQGNTIGSYRQYLAHHHATTDTHALEAKQKMDQLEWAAAVKASSIGSYEGYLDAHQTGLHAKEAQESIEKLEPYEEAPATFDFTVKISGDFRADRNGVTNAGPIKLYLGGHAIPLADPMIRDGLISTVGYGKIQIKIEPNFQAAYFLKASQREKLGRALARTRGRTP